MKVVVVTDRGRGTHRGLAVIALIEYVVVVMRLRVEVHWCDRLEGLGAHRQQAVVDA